MKKKKIKLISLFASFMLFLAIFINSMRIQFMLEMNIIMHTIIIKPTVVTAVGLLLLMVFLEFISMRMEVKVLPVLLGIEQ